VFFGTACDYSDVKVSNGYTLAQLGDLVSPTAKYLHSEKLTEKQLKSDKKTANRFHGFFQDNPSQLLPDVT